MQNVERKARRRKAPAEILKYAAAALLADFCSRSFFRCIFLCVSVPENSGNAAMPEGGFVVAWKPAYLFSLPQEGELVVFDPEERMTASGRQELEVAFYDEDEIRLEQVRGRVLIKLPGTLRLSGL